MRLNRRENTAEGNDPRPTPTGPPYECSMSNSIVVQPSERTRTTTSRGGVPGATG